MCFEKIAEKMYLKFILSEFRWVIYVAGLIAFVGVLMVLALPASTAIYTKGVVDSHFYINTDLGNRPMVRVALVSGGVAEVRADLPVALPVGNEVCLKVQKRIIGSYSYRLVSSEHCT